MVGSKNQNVIDPVLLNLRHPQVETCVANGEASSHSLVLPTRPVTPASAEHAPISSALLTLNTAVRRSGNGEISETASEYRARLNMLKQKRLLQEQCRKLGVKYAKQATLTKLRDILVTHSFPLSPPPSTTSLQTHPCPQKKARTFYDDTQQLVLENALASGSEIHCLAAPVGSRVSSACPPHCGELHAGIPLSVSLPPAPKRLQPPRSDTHEQLPGDEPWTATLTSASPRENVGEADSLVFRTEEAPDSERALLHEFCADPGAAAQLLGQDEEASDGEDEDEDDEERSLDSAQMFDKHAMAVRVEANKRFEAGRRQGGIQAQKSCVKAIDEFTEWALKFKKIHDNIINELFLLQFIKYHAEREKRTRRGIPIADTRLGASQLKKFFFGALRVRKQQDAKNPVLASTRPVTTGLVWDTIKERMSDAIKRAYRGENVGEDAPDVVANTILMDITDDDRDRIGRGFLAHRHLRLAVFGHLAWTGQSATGNRGDDIRSLALCEIQPYEMAHPLQSRKKIWCLLGLQSQEKAGKRGMKTVHVALMIF
ncbi:unnamed protein product, partial [Mycena citricolor]